MSQRGTTLYTDNSYRSLRNGTFVGCFGIVSTATVSIVADNTILLTILRTVSATAGTVNITADSPINLNTAIRFLATEGIVTVTGRPSLTVSITANLVEPSIKDVTSQLAIIDSTDIFEETVIDTEVI